MQTSDEIRKKLATLVGHLISRCIQEARMIPAVLHRDEVVNILVKDPALFQKLVQEEQADKRELSKQDLTIRLDAVKEMGKLDKIEALEQPFWDGPEVDLTPIMDVTNQLTRTFSVYFGNASTLFDKSFEEFMDKFRRSLHQAGLTLRTFDFTADDVKVLETNAMSYLLAGEFLQAFIFDRLLSSQIMIKQLVNLPAEGFSLRENLIRRALEDPNLYPGLARFVLRISYISHGSWDDLFPVFAKIILQEPGLCSSEDLVSFIEQDAFFSCNLLCKSYEEIRLLSADQRRSAIESSLEKYRD
jgi:hypothetical protein